MIKFFLFKKLFTKLLASYLLVTLLALVVLGVLFVYMMDKYFFRVEGWELSSQADKIISLVEEPIVNNNEKRIKELTRTLSYSYDVKLWVINKDGSIIASSEAGQPESGLELEENEMENVLAGNIITKQITGPEYNSLLYVKPIIAKNEETEKFNGKLNEVLMKPSQIEKKDIYGVLALESPLGDTSATITNIAKLGIWAMLPAILLAVFTGYVLSRRISRPVEEMNSVATDISKGNYDKRVQYKSGDEMEQLAFTFNNAVEQIVNTVEQQKKLERLRKEFLSNIAHEFKAPLTSIHGFLELMLDGKLNQEQQSKYIEIMLMDTTHLNRLVQDLVDLSNLESGEVSLDLSSLSPEELIKPAAEHFELKSIQSRIYLNTYIEPGLPRVKADRDRIYQVLLNLINNSFQHTPEEGRIQVNSFMDGNNPDTIHFTVEDTGSGIPNEELENIWDRFYKIDRARSRRHSSTGLGLAIVKEIVNKHGGQVYVESTPGKGSVFGFYLPVNPDF